MDNNDAIGRAKRKALMYIYKHDEEPKDKAPLASVLSSEVDHSTIEWRLIEERLLVQDSDTWRLTLIGRLYSEILQSSKRSKRYLAVCLTICLGVLSLLALRLIG